MGLALTSFVCVIGLSDFWSAQPYVSAGLLLGLVALPLDFSALLQRLNRANQELKLLSEELAQLARQDSLTGLPNRASFHQMLCETLEEKRREEHAFAILFLDLDGFKTINDTLGHASGDEIIRMVAHRLRTIVRRSDAVARLGGDEFVVLLHDLSSTDAEHLASAILDALSSPFTLGGESRHVSASIGIALYPDAGRDASTILARADDAMYRAKETGKNRYHVHGKASSSQAAVRALPLFDRA